MKNSSQPHSKSETNPKAVTSTVSEPPEGWLSTPEAAEVMGLTRRQFQGLSYRYQLPKIRTGSQHGSPACYAPSVIEQAIQDKAKREAKSAAEAKQRAEKKNEANQKSDANKEVQDTPAQEPSAVSLPAIDRPELYRQALSVVDRIVQNIGRMG